MLIILIIVSLSAYLGIMQKEELRDSERVFKELGESEKKREELLGGEREREREIAGLRKKGLSIKKRSQEVGGDGIY